MNQPIPFFANIDLRDNEIISVVLENRSHHPTTTKVGKLYYNTVDEVAYCYVGGGNWVDITHFYEHPKYQQLNPTLTGANILASLIVNDEGHVVGAETRILTLSDLGFMGDQNANYYIHPTINVSGTGTLSGALVISNVNVNSGGHVTGFATRELQPSDIGAAVINDSITDALSTWSGERIQSAIDQIDNGVVGVLRYRGSYDISTNTPNLNTIEIKQGYCYIVSGGKGIFAGEEVSNGDMIIAKTDNPQGDTDWSIIEKNIPDIEDATESKFGLIRLATDQEIIDGAEVVASVRPHQLNIWFENSAYNEFTDPMNIYVTARDS